MKCLIILAMLLACINCGPELAQATEPGQFVNPNPVDVSPAWRGLAGQYKAQIDSLRAKRGEKQTEQNDLKADLDKIDMDDVFDKSNKEVEKSAKDTFKSVGDAFVDYFKDFGELIGVVSAGRTTAMDAVDSLKDEVEAYGKPHEVMEERDRLERNIDDLDSQMKSYDKDIDIAQRNMDLSNKAADIYSENAATDSSNRQKIVFKLVDKSRQINQTASTNIEHYLDTVPPGWVACHCPAVHRAYGRVVHGILYHPANLLCPN